MSNVRLSTVLHFEVLSQVTMLLLFLVTERCRTDDLLPDLPVPNLPPCRVDPKILGLDVL